MGVIAAPEKVIKDNVHGYIHIPETFVDNLIDDELFQRLRHIEQTSGSMRALYPAARHDRFSHSLGVFHLGCQVFESLYQQYANGELMFGEEDGACSQRAWWMRHYVLFSIACLLHDCAHAPFSHALEDYYDMPRQEQDSDGIIEDEKLRACAPFKKLDYELLREYGRLDRDFETDFFSYEENGGIAGVGSPHERVSALMVHRHFKDPIRRVFRDLRREKAFGDEDVRLKNSDFARMARMIIGCKYKNARSTEQSLVNCFISLLNSSLIDVDGLDYEVRDTVNSGISNWDVDYERIINSIKLCCATSFKDVELMEAHVRRAVWCSGSRFDMAFLDDLEPRGAICVRGRCSIRFDALESLTRYVQVHSQQAMVNAVCNGLQQLDPHQFAERMADGSVGISDAVGSPSAASLEAIGSGLQPFVMDDSKFDVNFDECTITALYDDSFIKVFGHEINPEIHVELSSECEVELVGFTGVVDGTVCIAPDDLGRITGDLRLLTRPHPNSKGAYFRTFVVGYWMNAIGLMSNAVDARNTFYRWIYTHPTPVYQCDFLLQYMVKLASKYLCCTHYRSRLRNAFPGANYPMIDCSGCPVSKASKKKGKSGAGKQPPPERITFALLGLDGFFAYDQQDEACEMVAPFRFRCSTDDDLNAVFRWVYLNNELAGDKRNETFHQVFSEYFCRPRRKPLWKSYADFCRVFGDMAPLERPQFKKFGASEGSSNVAYASNSKVRYLTFIDEDEQVAAICNRLSVKGLHNFVAVKAKANVKKIDPAAMLIVFPKRQVARLVDVDNATVACADPQDFFYLYAEPVK